MNKFAGWLLIVSVAALAGCGPAEPLGLAAAGVATSMVLDKAEQKANAVIGNAANAASLVVSKSARDAQLLVSAARQQLHGELETNWDRLSSEKISLLREVDRVVKTLDTLGAGTAKLQDSIVLDIDSAIGKLPFAKSTPFIRRVEGASLYYREGGSYRIVVTTNLGELARTGVTATMGSRSLDVTPVPPFGIAVTVPGELVANLFNPTEPKLASETVVLHALVDNDRGWKLWKPAERAVELPFKIELFPRRAVTYSLIERRAVPDVDRGRPTVMQAQDHTVNGCGNDGCNAYHRFCASAPEGSLPIRPVEFRDTFANQWGGWSAPTVEGTQVCATFWQHSHNVNRNVGFNVEYFPAVLRNESVPVVLQKLGVPQPAGLPALAASEAGSVAKSEVATDVLDIGSHHTALFSMNYASYDLVVRTFTGETFVATPAMAPSPGSILSVSPLETSGSLKRITVEIKLPW